MSQQSHFLSYTRDSMRADDMLQDLFLKVLRLDFIAPSTAKHLLFHSASNLITDDMRRCNRWRNVQSTLMEQECSYEPTRVYDDIDRRTLCNIIDMKMDSMPQKRTRAFQLWRDGKEIALKLNISSRTAECHIYKATKELKQCLNRAVI